MSYWTYLLKWLCWSNNHVIQLIWSKHGNLLLIMTMITLPSPFTSKLKLIEGNAMRDSILHDSSHQRVKQQ